jgi:hypothetical protein
VHADRAGSAGTARSINAAMPQAKERSLQEGQAQRSAAVVVGELKRRMTGNNDQRVALHSALRLTLTAHPVKANSGWKGFGCPI